MPASTVLRRRWLAGLLGLTVLAVAVPAGSAVPAAAVPAAPRPTSTAVSPGAPDPHPPAGGRAPNGTVPGGARLAGRGLVLPAGAPALPKNIGAHAWVLADLDTGEVLAARDPHGRYQPASVLKMLTALTVLPNLPGSRVVQVSALAANAEGSSVGLLAGAKYTVDELFAAMLLVSGNDAATALAQANGGITRTVAQMNAKIGALGGYDTFVQTPSGLDGWQQLTSAYDLALVLRAVVRQPRLLAYDKLTDATFPAKSSVYGRVGSYEFDNQSTPFLTTVPGALLAKIGYTDAARHTYFAAARRNGRTLGVILLRDERVPVDQPQQAAALFAWGYKLKPTVQPVGTLAGPISADVPASTPSTTTAAPAAPSRSAAPGATAAAPASKTSELGWPLWPTVTAGLALVVVAAAAARVSRRRARRRR